MANPAILSPTYFGPIQWYQKVVRHDPVWVDHGEPFRKQSYHNRCLIMTSNGPQALIVPVASGKPYAQDSTPLISNHGKWRHEHWNALCTAYGDSPFFLYYADDIRPFFEEEHWTNLFDFNLDITRKICELLEIIPPQPFTSKDTAMNLSEEETPRRYVIQPKHPLPDPDFQPRPYFQVYRQRHGFQPNLSILDLLFNMGPEAILYLQ